MDSNYLPLRPANLQVVILLPGRWLLKSQSRLLWSEISARRRSALILGQWAIPIGSRGLNLTLLN